MATKLTLHISLKGSEQSGEVLVSETYDEVLNKLWPLQQASSALEFRQEMMYTKPDGDRLTIHKNSIIMVEENGEISV